MPGGYGQIDTPWGTGGTGPQATVAQTSGFGGGQGGQGGSNAVAQAANDIKQAQALGVNDKGQTVQEAQASFANTLAQSGQSGIAGLSANQIQSQINAQAAEEERIRLANLPKNGTGLGELPIVQGVQNILHGVIGDTSKIFDSLPGLPNILKGAQSTDRFFKNLASGKPLNTEDKIILANLIAANKKNPKVLGDWEKYAEKFDVADSKGWFKSSLDDAISDLENTDYQSLIDQYETGKPTGLSGFFDIGEGRTDGITLEELKDQLGSEGLAYLKANDPAKYYSFTQPQTTGSLEELAGMDATQYPGTDLAQKIFDAREEVDRQKYDQGIGGGGQGIAGIPSISPPLYTGPITPFDPNAIVTQPGEITYPEGYGSFLLNPPPPVSPGTPTVQGFPDSDGDGIDDRWQAGPGQPFHGVEPVEGPLTTTAAATTPTPFDYSQWPQFTSAYPGHYANWGAPSYAANGGIVSQARPQYNYWNQIANAFPGMSQYG